MFRALLQNLYKHTNLQIKIQHISNIPSVVHNQCNLREMKYVRKQNSSIISTIHSEAFIINITKVMMMIEERKNTSVFSDSTDNDANDGDDNVISSSRGQGALFSLLLREKERQGSV